MEKKKKIMITAILAVLLIGATSITLIMTGKDRSKNTATTETMEADKEDNKAIMDAEVEADADAEESKEEKKQEDKKDTTTETATMEENKDDTNASKKENEKKEEQTTETLPTQPTVATEEKKQEDKKDTTTEAPSQPSTTEKEKVWHEPEYVNEWVVDVPAHTETQQVFVRYADQCYCGHVFEIGEDINAHVKDMEQLTTTCYGYWTDCYPIYETREVQIEEQGHYEKKLVKEGYWE